MDRKLVHKRLAACVRLPTALVEGMFNDVEVDMVEIVLYLHGIRVEPAATQGFLFLIGIAEGGDEGNPRVKQADVDAFKDFAHWPSRMRNRQDEQNSVALSSLFLDSSTHDAVWTNKPTFSRVLESGRERQ